MFDLTKEQLEKAEDFRKHHGCTLDDDGYGDKNVGAIGGRMTYHFTPTGLGVITAISCACGDERDLTEFENW